MSEIIAAGDLDRRITIERASVARDGDFNGEVKAEPWPVVATVWAKVIEGAREEDSAEGVRVGSRRATFRIRYRSDILATDRIGFAGRKFRIIGDPTEVGYRVALDIEAEAFSV